MLGVCLLFVGIVLINNGMCTLYKVDGKSTAVMNILTGGLSLFINFVNLVMGNYYAAGTGLLFCFTYLFVAFSKILNKSDSVCLVFYICKGDKIPRKGGPGITRSDLLVINKIDLAPYVGASLEVMDRDSKKMRGERPFVFTNIRGDENVDIVVEWIKKNVLLEGM